MTTSQPCKDQCICRDTILLFIFFIIIFPRDVRTFAHLNVLSGCCYRYPRRAQRGGEGTNWEKVRRRSKWGGDAAEKESDSQEAEGARRRMKQCRHQMGNNNPAGSEFIKSERMCEWGGKREGWRGKSRRTSPLPVSASKPWRVIYSPSYTPTHPLNASS